MSTIGHRLREERLRLGMNQADLGAAGGVMKNSQLNYEKDERTPDASYLEGVAKAGVDVLYVVTGRRERGGASESRQQLSGVDVERGTAAAFSMAEARGIYAPRLNDELLGQCIAAVEVALEARGRTLPPEQRSRIYLGVYELSLGQGEVNAKAVETMLRVLLAR